MFRSEIWLGVVQWSDSIWTLLYLCFSSFCPHFTLTAFTLYTECLLDQCLSCHTDYSLCLTEPGFLCLLPLNSLCVTDSCMMQIHVTCWGFVNCEISLNPYISVLTKTKQVAPWLKTTVQTRNCQSPICIYSSVSFLSALSLDTLMYFFSALFFPLL